MNQNKIEVKMKMGQLFWGSFLIALGALFLVNNATLLQTDWELLFKIWPLILALVGLLIILKSTFYKRIVTATIAIALALISFAAYKQIASFKTPRFFLNKSIKSVGVYSPAFDSTQKKAVLNFLGAAGNFTLKEVTDSLAFIDSYEEEGIFQFKNKKKEISISVNGNETGFQAGGFATSAEIKLNPNPIWTLYFNMSAGEFDADLSKFKVEEIKVEANAGSIDLKFGDNIDTIKAILGARASTIKLRIPENSGCEITTKKSFLSDKSLPGFKKISDNIHRTENFDHAKKKIFISISPQASSIKIKRY